MPPSLTCFLGKFRSQVINVLLLYHVDLIVYYRVDIKPKTLIYDKNVIKLILRELLSKHCHDRVVCLLTPE